MIQGFEDVDIELTGGWRVEWKLQSHKDVGKALHTDTDGASVVSRAVALRGRVGTGIDKSIRVANSELRHLVKGVKVEGSAFTHETGEGYGSQSADASFILRGVLYNLRA